MKYKSAKDKLRSTGYGRGGDVSDNDSEGNEGQDIIPKHSNDMDDIVRKENLLIHATCLRAVLRSWTSIAHWKCHKSTPISKKKKPWMKLPKIKEGDLLIGMYPLKLELLQNA